MSTSAAVPKDSPKSIHLGWLVLCIGLLMIGTFDLPGRGDTISLGSLDYVSLFKLASRLAVIAIAGPIVFFQLTKLFESRPLRTYLPWIVLTIWAFVSVL